MRERMHDATADRTGGPQTGPDRRSDRTGLADNTPADPRWMNVVDVLVVIGLSLIIVGTSAVGQVQGARNFGIDDGMEYTTPFIFELAYLGFMWLGYRVGRDNQSPMPFWVLGWGVGAAAVYSNVFHSTPGAAWIFGCASAVSLLLTTAKLFVAYRKFLRENGKLGKPRPKFGRDWLFSPRVAFRALLISSKVDSDKPRLCMNLAQTWQVHYRSQILYRRHQAGPRYRWWRRTPNKMLAKITAWNEVFHAAGMPQYIVVIPEVMEIAEIKFRQRAIMGQDTPTIDAEVVDERRELDGPDKPGDADDSSDQKRAKLPPADRPERKPKPKAITADSDSVSNDPYVRYRKQLMAISEMLPDNWHLGEKEVSSDDVREAQLKAIVAGTLMESDAKKGKQYLLLFKWLLELVSARSAKVPEAKITGLLGDVDREKLREYRDQLQPE